MLGSHEGIGVRHILGAAAAMGILATGLAYVVLEATDPGRPSTPDTEIPVPAPLVGIESVDSLPTAPVDTLPMPLDSRPAVPLDDGLYILPG